MIGRFAFVIEKIAKRSKRDPPSVPARFSTVLAKRLGILGSDGKRRFQCRDGLLDIRCASSVFRFVERRAQIVLCSGPVERIPRIRETVRAR